MVLVKKHTVPERLEALKLGLKSYDTGKTCNNGHDSPRSTLTGQCLMCRKEAAIRNKNGTTRKNFVSEEKSEMRNPPEGYISGAQVYLMGQKINFAGD